MAKPKRVLWLAAEVTPEYRAKQQLLEKHNHHVTWVHSLAELAKEVTKQRAHAIVLSEEGSTAMVCDHILGLSTLTEAKGSRWILTLKEYNAKVIKFATGSNFRDLIPINLPASQWIFRFLYASASKAVTYPLPPGQITLGHRTDISLPFRLIWLTQTTLRLETHIIPMVGSRLTLAGSVFTELGATSANLVVTKVEHRQLTYRFSTAIEGEWTMNEGVSQERVGQLIRLLQQYSPKPRYRVFIAIKTPETRKRLLRFLNPEQFDINSALAVRSLTQEPQFFGPDLVVIDSIFCQRPYREHLERMQASLPPHVPIVLLVGETPQPYPGTNLFGERQVHYVRQIDGDFMHLIKTHLPQESILQNRLQKGAAYFDASDRRGFGEVSVTGKINKLHPLLTEIAMPFAIKDFAVCQLSSPLLTKWLRKDPWVKLTQISPYATPDEGLFRFVAPAYFVDLSEEDRRQLTTNLGRFIAKVLGFTAGFAEHQTAKPAGGLAISAGALTKEQPSKDSASPNSPAAGLASAVAPSYTLSTSLPVPPHENADAHLSAVKADYSRRVKAPRQPWLITVELQKLWRSESVRYFLIFVVLSVLFLGVFIEVIPRLVPYYRKSGGTYVDQLSRFSKPPSEGKGEEE